MKSSAKAKSFHVAVRGNFPTARDFAEPDNYTTTHRQAVGNDIDIISGITHHLNRLTINGPPTGDPDIESPTFSQRAIRRASRRHGTERSIECAVAMELRAIHRVSRRHGATNNPTPKPHR